MTMVWNSWSDFFHMGGYAPYVWGAYVVTLGLMAAEAGMAAQRRRRAFDLAHEEAST
jgi:heme exporter protein D